MDATIVEKIRGELFRPDERSLHIISLQRMLDGLRAKPLLVIPDRRCLVQFLKVLPGGLRQQAGLEQFAKWPLVAKPFPLWIERDEKQVLFFQQCQEGRMILFGIRRSFHHRITQRWAE